LQPKLVEKRYRNLEREAEKKSVFLFCRFEIASYQVYK